VTGVICVQLAAPDAQSNAAESDWSKDLQGDSFLDQAAAGGSPDFQAWIRDRRDAFDSLLKKYSGDNLARHESELDAYARNFF
jgi:hypothetical protein